MAPALFFGWAGLTALFFCWAGLPALFFDVLAVATALFFFDWAGLTALFFGGRVVLLAAPPVDSAVLPAPSFDELAVSPAPSSCVSANFLFSCPRRYLLLLAFSERWPLWFLRFATMTTVYPRECFLSHVVTDNQTQFLGLMDHIWIGSFALLLVHLAPPVRAS